MFFQLNKNKNHVVQVVAGVCVRTEHFTSVEIGHLKMNVMDKDHVGVREVMAQPRSHTRPSCRVSLHCFLLHFFFFFWCLGLSEVAQPPRSNKLPSISQTCFQSRFALPPTRACAAPVAAALNRVERTSLRFTADKNTSAICARRSRWRSRPLRGARRPFPRFRLQWFIKSTPSIIRIINNRMTSTFGVTVNIHELIRNKFQKTRSILPSKPIKIKPGKHMY